MAAPRSHNFSFILQENVDADCPASDENLETLEKKKTDDTGQKTSAALASTGSTRVIALTWQTFDPVIEPVEATAKLDPVSEADMLQL